VTLAVLGSELRAALASWRRLLTEQHAAWTAGDPDRALELATEADWLVLRVVDLADRLRALPEATDILETCRQEGAVLLAELGEARRRAEGARDGIVRQLTGLALEQRHAQLVGYGRPAVKGLSALDRLG
jgi:hypothetical protein